jgi:hypothetical protein
MHGLHAEKSTPPTQVRMIAHIACVQHCLESLTLLGIAHK